MKTFLNFVKEATADTEKNDAEEIKRQKKHLADKVKEYMDQAERERMYGLSGGAAAAKGQSFADAAKNIK